MYRMHLTRDREKAEQILFEHVRKAVNSQETAPKQKHVRGCIVFSWDNQTSIPFWAALKMQPVLSDPVSCFKALVTIHKLLVNGPHVVLSEATNEVAFLEQCARLHGSSNGSFSSSYGYGPLISSYVSFLLTKVDFHRTHPEFTGNFDYEEYLSIKGVQDLDEGYKTIDEMMELQERLDLFQKSVFENFGAAAGSVECRISAFVPLIDESYGMYKFVTSMLSAMHLSVESPDPLVLLVERYNSIFHSLKEFYTECAKIRYLTSLVAIPQLPERPPLFTDEALKKFTGSRAFHRAEVSRETVKSNSSSNESKSSGNTTVIVQVPAAPAPSQVPVSMASNAMMAPLSTGMYDGMLMQRVNAEIIQMQTSLQAATAQHHQDQAALQELRDECQKAEQRTKSLGERYNQLVGQANAQGEDLREQIAHWKRKYESCAKLYNELRERYLQLTQKLTENAKNVQYSAALQSRLQELESLRLEDQQSLTEQDMALEELRTRCEQLSRELEEMRLEENVIGGEIEDQLRDELARAAAEITKAAGKLADLRAVAGLHEDLVDAATALTSAISRLIEAAREVQRAIVDSNTAADMSGDSRSFYKKNSVWTAGLISAAQAVAGATNHVVDSADCLLRGEASTTPEHLVVASTGVTAATAQLMAAARVKADATWPSSAALEAASRSVSESNRSLVNLVSSKAGSLGVDSDGSGDGSKGFRAPASAQEYKIAEMNQQVEVLSLERRIQAARVQLARLRQSQYNELNEDGGGDAEGRNHAELSALNTFNAEEDNELPMGDEWLLTVPPALEELRL